MAEVPHANVYEALAAFNAEFDGYIHKGGQVSGFASYTYAGERDVIAKLRPLMVKHGLFIMSAGVRDVVRTERTRRNGGIDYVTSAVFIYRVGHASGSELLIETLGEGADSGDKGAYKAMTGAFKYALRQMACAETGDDPDDTPSEQYERAAPAPRQQPAPKPSAKPSTLADKVASVMPEAELVSATGQIAPKWDAWTESIRERSGLQGQPAQAFFSRFWLGLKAEAGRHGVPVNGGGQPALAALWEGLGAATFERMQAQALIEAGGSRQGGQG